MLVQSASRPFLLPVTVLLAGFLSACSGPENDSHSQAQQAENATSEQSGQNSINSPLPSSYEYVPPQHADKNQRPVQAALQLPQDDDEPVTLAGVISQWDYEGDEGCFGALQTRDQEIQLWADIELCDDVDYQPHQNATIEVVYRAEDQHSQDILYTVVGFL